MSDSLTHDHDWWGPHDLVYETENDWWGPSRARMRVFLEELESIFDSEVCVRPGCSSTADFRAAVATIRRVIDAFPPGECEHQAAVSAELHRQPGEEGS